ncbi:uncharacterized protein LOC132703961 [Cylas formicarius]|uniref:uncharacterized protein LOC132703961 n=1 Tax=Cylas formicarius TaxID=197179 RepID=UPI0029589F0F|nr:uncharacterized protein LOC132703961 [Cylas formicarius]
MRFVVWKISAILIIFLIAAIDADPKRSSGGRSRGKSSGSGSWWSSRRKSSGSSTPTKTDVKPDSAPGNVKPSAPKAEPAIKKESSKTQQASPGQHNQPQQPIGWNVGHNTNTNPQTGGGWRSGYQNQAAPPAYSASAHHPSYGAAPPAYNGQATWGSPPGYSAHGTPYGGHYGGFGQNNYPHQTGGYHPHQSFSGYHQSPVMGGMGIGQSWGGSGFGYGNKGYGGYGGGFGGMGGYGGMGGFGGPGYYPMKKSGGFFSGSTLRNVLTGMMVWHLASSLFKRPYTVHNYYNQPADAKVPEIQLPANVLTLCDGNVTSLCAPETIPVCTTNGTVICAAAANQRAPCHQDPALSCVDTTVPCADANDPLCQNSTKKDRLEAVVNMPCLTNLTLDVNLLDKSSTQPNTNYVYCVTTMAVAGPKYDSCKDLGNSTNDYRTVLNGHYEWFLESDGFRRNYSVYNYERPMEVSGEIHMPVNVLVNCSENATKICAPATAHVCTTFNEIMCVASTSVIEECSSTNGSCVKSTVPCLEGSEDKFCQNANETTREVEIELPCFANITINAPISNFQLEEYNGTLPEQLLNSSYTYHYSFCVVTLALPGSDADLCVI